eukprot:11433103-Alexandrium_andersonii.AAC.2
MAASASPASSASSPCSASTGVAATPGGICCCAGGIVLAKASNWGGILRSNSCDWLSGAAGASRAFTPLNTQGCWGALRV